MTHCLLYDSAFVVGRTPGPRVRHGRFRQSNQDPTECEDGRRERRSRARGAARRQSEWHWALSPANLRPIVNRPSDAYSYNTGVGALRCPCMFEQAFKNIEDVLWKEAGCTTELDYTEQTSWLLFLKYLDGLEQDKADEAALESKRYSFSLDKAYRWETWAAPRGKDGQIDHNRAMTGDDLRDFVNGKLFPYLHGFKQKASGPNTIEYKIGEIFGEIKNKI